MAALRRKAATSAPSRIVSLVLERGFSLARSEKLDLGRLVDPRSAAWDEALTIAPLPLRDLSRSNCFGKIDVTQKRARLPPRDERRSDFIEEVGRQLGIGEIQGELVQIDHRLTTMNLRLDRLDMKIDRLEAKLDARFDEVRKMMQKMLASSRAEEAVVEDIEEEAAVIEKEQDDEVITTSKEEEEDAEEAVAEEEMVASEDEVEVVAENKEVMKERKEEVHLPILITNAYFDPFLILCDKQGRTNERNLLLVAFLQLSEYCPPSVCKNALKRLGLQFAVEMGMIRVVGDEMLLPLPRPPPKPPPEPPPKLEDKVETKVADGYGHYSKAKKCFHE